MINLTERLASTDLAVYRGTSEQDLILTRWWLHLQKTGDIHLITWSDQNRTLANFLGIFRSPTILIYATNASHEIEYAMWFEKFANGAFSSIWLDEELRKGVTHARHTITIHALMLEIFPVILNATHQQSHNPLFTHMGYEKVGSVPFLFGADSDLYHITQQLFNSKWGDKIENNHEMRHQQ